MDYYNPFNTLNPLSPLSPINPINTQSKTVTEQPVHQSNESVDIGIPLICFIAFLIGLAILFKKLEGEE